MAGCCDNRYANSVPRVLKCPLCGSDCHQVAEKTILHHIKDAWTWEGYYQCYYFCANPDCEAVYIGRDNSVITQAGIRTAVGNKLKPAQTLLCFCFGITRGDAIANPEIKAFVKDKTSKSLCACEVRNPSGKCCLKDFPY